MGGCGGRPLSLQVPLGTSFFPRLRGHLLTGEQRWSGEGRQRGSDSAGRQPSLCNMGKPPSCSGLKLLIAVTSRAFIPNKRTEGA